MTVVAAVSLAAAIWVGFPGGARRRCRAVGRPSPAVRPAPARKANGAAVLDLVSAVLDAGLAPATAVGAVSAALPDYPGLRRAAAMLDVTGEPAWRALADDPDVGQLAAAMTRSEQSGAPVAESVRVLADEIRRAERTERMARARGVGVRTAAPLGLCFLPAFFAVAVVPTVLGLISSVL